MVRKFTFSCGFFYLSTVNVEGASVNHGCNKGDGTEGITGCIYLS